MKILKSPWFKCVACLLILMLFSGSSITILAELLYVSPEMRTMRAIKKIYGEEKEYATVLDVDADNTEINKPLIFDGVGQIDKIYRVSDDLLFRTTGYQGYKNGTVTLWIKAIQNGETDSIEKVLLETSEKQTLMSKLTGDFYDGFKLTDVTEAYNDGSLFTATEKTAENYNPVSGATYSATAAANAVNCVIKYLGGER